MLELFKEIDYLGKEFRFEHEGNNRHKTVYGAMFSLITFTAALVFAILIGQEVYQRKNPNISMSNQKIDDSIIHLRNFPITFSFHHIDSSEFDPNAALDIEVHWIRYPPQENIEELTMYKNYTLVPCEQVLDRFNRSDPSIEDFIQNSIISTSFKEYCINFIDGMFIRREQTHPSCSYLSVRLAYCDPEKRSDCTYERSHFNNMGTVIGFGFKDNYVDAINYSNPVLSTFKRIIISLSAGIRKTEFFHLVRESFISDDGWITEDKREISYYTHEYDKEVVLNDQSRNALALVVDSPRLTKKTVRNYLKIQELFARVGGLANAFMISIKILTYHFIKFKFYFFVHENSFAVIEEGLKISPNNMDSSAKIQISKDNIGAMSQLGKESKKIGTERKDEQEEVREISKSGMKLMKKESNIVNKLLSALPVPKEREEELRQGSNLNNRSNNYVNLRNNSEEAQKVTPKKRTEEVREEGLERKKSKKDGEFNYAPSKSLKSVELRKERKEVINGNSECRLDSPEIRYSYYLRNTLFPCCLSNELKRKYDHEIKRITQVLNVKSLYHFLVESYSIEKE